MKRIIIKNLVLFFAGFCTYITIETIFRGYSYPLCGMMGGLSVMIIDKINDEISWDVDLLFQALYGSALITVIEFIVGFIAKYTHIIPIMWDYTDVPFNFDGIICIPFSVAWLFLSVIAIFLADSINYYVFEDTIVPHYNLFGGLFCITFHEKECSNQR